jgi:hypothetical protein
MLKHFRLFWRAARSGDVNAKRYLIALGVVIISVAPHLYLLALTPKNEYVALRALLTAISALAAVGAWHFSMMYFTLEVRKSGAQTCSVES